VTPGPDRGVGRPPWWLVAAGAAVAAVLAAALLTGGAVARLDGRVSAVVDGWRLDTGATGRLLRLAGELGGRAVLAVVLLAVAAVIGRRHRTVRPLLQALLALAVLSAVVCAVKLGVDRVAPAAGAGPAARGGTSFPSGHVANAVVVWGVVRWQAVAYRVRPVVQQVAGGCAVVAPAVAGVAMLLVGFHWLSDLLAGAAIGVSLLGVVHALDGVALSLWVRARAGRRIA